MGMTHLRTILELLVYLNHTSCNQIFFLSYYETIYCVTSKNCWKLILWSYYQPHRLGFRVHIVYIAHLDLGKFKYLFVILLNFLYMFQQPKSKRIRYFKRTRKATKVHVVEDSLYLTRWMPIIFAMMAYLATNPGRNLWKEPRHYTYYDIVKGDVWLHDPILRDKKNT